MSRSWHWRNTWRPARFFFLDAKAGVVLLLALLHIRPWTIALAAGIVSLFWWPERKGLGFPEALKAARAWLAGRDRPPVKRVKLRRRVDYEHEGWAGR